MNVARTGCSIMNFHTTLRAKGAEIGRLPTLGIYPQKHLFTNMPEPLDKMNQYDA
jgi:hypothetical protein